MISNIFKVEGFWHLIKLNPACKKKTSAFSHLMASTSLPFTLTSPLSPPPILCQLLQDSHCCWTRSGVLVRSLLWAHPGVESHAGKVSSKSTQPTDQQHFPRFPLRSLRVYCTATAPISSMHWCVCKQTASPSVAAAAAWQWCQCSTQTAGVSFSRPPWLEQNWSCLVGKGNI